MLDVHNKNQKVMKGIGGNTEEEEKKSLISFPLKNVIERITQYQLRLHDPGKELSYMLENAIDFLKNLDKYAKTSCLNGIFL